MKLQQSHREISWCVCIYIYMFIYIRKYGASKLSHLIKTRRERHLERLQPHQPCKTTCAVKYSSSQSQVLIATPWLWIFTTFIGCGAQLLKFPAARMPSLSQVKFHATPWSGKGNAGNQWAHMRCGNDNFKNLAIDTICPLTFVISKNCILIFV